MMVPKTFAPYMPKNVITFNIYEQPIGIHPVVVWYNGDEDMYYYVKARTKKDNIAVSNKNPKFNSEILIPAGATLKNYLFKKDSYLDCSQIFKIDKDQFLEAYGSDKFPKAWELPFNYSMDILNKIEENLKSNHISLMEISVDGYDKNDNPIIKPELLYASQSSWEQESNWYNNLIDKDQKKMADKSRDAYYKKNKQINELNIVESALKETKDSLVQYRILDHIYQFIQDYKLLDKELTIVEIKKEVEKNIINDAQFNNFKLKDAHIWASLATPWEQPNNKLTFEQEYKINSSKLKNNQLKYFFKHITNEQLVALKEAYKQNKLYDWVLAGHFNQEYHHYFEQCLENLNWSSNECAAEFIKYRYCIDDISIIDNEIKNRI